MALLQRLLALLRPRRLDHDLDEELRSHVEMRTADLIAQGIPPEEARARALRVFGNSALMKEEARAFDTVQWLETLIQDVRYGLRQLARNPGFTLVAALTLALGIGANTAIFTGVNAVLLKRLPYADPGRLIALRGSHSLPDVLDLTRLSQSVSAMAGWAAWPLDILEGGRPQRIDAALVGGDLFQIFGVAPFLGGVFSEADGVAGKAVVVASYDFWQTHLGGDLQAIGRPLRLSGNTYTLIGVMPAGFRFPNSTSQLWVPFRVGYPEAVNARGAHFMYAVARLRQGATLPQFNAELVSIGKRLAEMYPEETRTFLAMPLRERFVGEVRTPLLVLLGAVGMVLLIACGNFATLLLARAGARRQEMQVRSAVGARPLRLVRQLLTEHLMLSLLAGLLGIAIAHAGVRALLALVPEDVPKIFDISVDPVALAFTFGISVTTGLVFGAVPAFQIMRDGYGHSAGDRVIAVRSTARRVLVTAEMALALMLLAGAGLLIRSLWHLHNVPLGMEPQGVLTMRLSLPSSRYGPIVVQEQFLARLDEALQSTPGIEQAGLISELPLSGWRMMHNMIVEGQPEVPAGQEPEIFSHEISPGFFSTMRTQLLAGRDFGAHDTPTSPLVGIVNQAFVKRFLAGRDPLGARARWARMNPPHWITIVGVVPDIRFESLEEPQEPTMYTPYRQKQQVWKRFSAIVLRPRPGGGAALAEAVRQKVWSLDPQLPVTHVLPMDEVMRQAIQERRFVTVVLAAFAALAVLLAMMGVYGVISYLVTQRRQEVGIRVALGARRVDILWMMLRQGLPLLGLGLLLGGLGALASTRVLRKLLYGTSSTDLPTFAVVAVLLVLVALLAMLVPARRATQIDPLSALRAE